MPVHSRPVPRHFGPGFESHQARSNLELGRLASPRLARWARMTNCGTHHRASGGSSGLRRQAMARAAVDQARSVRTNACESSVATVAPRGEAHEPAPHASFDWQLGHSPMTAPTIPDMHCTYGPLKNIRSLIIFRPADFGDSQGVRPCHLPRGLRPSDLGLHGLPRAADEIRNCAAVRHYGVPDRGLRAAAGLTTARFPHGPAIGDFLPRGVRRPRVLLIRAFPA